MRGDHRQLSRCILDCVLYEPFAYTQPLLLCLCRYPPIPQSTTALNPPPARSTNKTCPDRPKPPALRPRLHAPRRLRLSKASSSSCHLRHEPPTPTHLSAATRDAMGQQEPPCESRRCLLISLGTAWPYGARERVGATTKHQTSRHRRIGAPAPRTPLPATRPLLRRPRSRRAGLQGTDLPR